MTPAQVESIAVVASENDGKAPPNGQRQAKNGTSRIIRRLHFWFGALLTINFVVLVATGLLVQHRAFFRLEERTISRKWLPAGYRPQDPDSEIRADIVITDLHSCRLFGPRGPLIVDAAAAGLLWMIASGFSMQLVCRYRNHRNHH